MTLTIAPSSNVALIATHSPLMPMRLITLSNCIASPFSPTEYTSKKLIMLLSYMFVINDMSMWGLFPSPRAASEALGNTFLLSIDPLRTCWCSTKLWVHPHFPAPHHSAKHMRDTQEWLQHIGRWQA